MVELILHPLNVDVVDLSWLGHNTQNTCKRIIVDPGI